MADKNWRDALAKAGKSKKLPSYITANALPTLKVKAEPDATLDMTELIGLIATLRAQRLSTDSATLERLKANIDPASARQFARAMLGIWRSKGYVATYKWMLEAQLLGDEEVIPDLTALIDRWMFGTSAERDRAVLILRTLAAMRSPHAFTAVARYAANERSPKTRDCALFLLEQEARSRRISIVEFEDLIVPDYGLDARGHRQFDYGPRSFDLVLGEGLWPAIRLPNGKILGGLPPTRRGDNPEKVEEAKHAWAILKEELKLGVKFHRERYRRHMAGGRKWEVSHWREHVLTHPFMQHFARNLLWSYTHHDSARGLQTTHFHVVEDLSCATIEDEELAIDDRGRITLTHVASLSEQERLTWIERFVDYEKFPPFDQLSWDLFSLDGLEHSKFRLTEFAKTTFAPRALRTHFKYNGWARGEIDERANLRTTYERHFPHVGMIAVMHLDPGLNVGSYHGDLPQQIAAVTFTTSSRERDLIPLSEVSPVQMSEILRDIHIIERKS